MKLRWIRLGVSVLATLAVALPMGASATTGVIETAVGGEGDGGPPELARVGPISGVAVDGLGNVFVAEERDDRIRKIDTNGIVSSIGGGALHGHARDVPADGVALSDVQGISVDFNGNLYAALRGTHDVVKIDSAGILSDVVGGGWGFSGDGGPAKEARLKDPMDVAAAPSGDLYIADHQNNRVRKVDSETGLISTYAGNGVGYYTGDGIPATLSGIDPVGIAVDAQGNLFIADRRNARVRKVDTSGVISTVAGIGSPIQTSALPSGDGGPATLATLALPQDVAVSNSGDLYIAQRQGLVRKVDANTGIITTVAGTGEFGSTGDGGPATEAELQFPRQIHLDSAGRLYIADYWAKKVRVVDTSGTISTLIGFPQPFDGVEPRRAWLDAPTGVSIGPDGQLYLVDANHDRVRKIDEFGLIRSVAGTGGCCYGGDGGLATDAEIDPFRIAFDAEGDMYIAEGYNNTVRRVDANGIITTFAGTTDWSGSIGDGGPATEAFINGPRDLAFDAEGNVYITEAHGSRVRRVDPSGIITTVAGTGNRGYSGDGGPATEADLDWPGTIAIGPDGDLYIADAGNYRIRRVELDTGIITTIAGTGENANTGDGGPASEAALSPTVIRFDSAGNLYVAVYRAMIRRIDTAGIIATIAGSGESGFSGDGGPALEARFGFIWDLAIDSAGAIYVADSNNNRIRKITGS